MPRFVGIEFNWTLIARQRVRRNPVIRFSTL